MTGERSGTCRAALFCLRKGMSISGCWGPSGCGGDFETLSNGKRVLTRREASPCSACRPVCGSFGAVFLFSPGVFASWGPESAFRLMGPNRVFPDWPDDLLCPLDDRFPTPGNVSPLLSGPSGRILFSRPVSSEYPPNKKGRDLSGPDPCRCKDLRCTKLYSAF